MKTVTKTFTIYSFDELSGKARDKTICYYEQSLVDSDEFTDYSMDELNSLFPQSSLNVEYELDYCQRDYFNFYGSLSLADLFAHISDKLTAKQARLYRHILKEWRDTCEIPRGYYYNHWTASSVDIFETAVSDMEFHGYANIPYRDIEAICDIARSYLAGVCGSLKSEGYSFFYPDSEYIRDYYNDNDYYFTADGTPYYS